MGGKNFDKSDGKIFQFPSDKLTKCKKTFFKYRLLQRLSCRLIKKINVNQWKNFLIFTTTRNVFKK